MDRPIDFNKISLDKFEIIENLGEGSFGKVCLAEYKLNNHLYALKFIKYKYRNTVTNGIDLSMKFNHDNLLHCYGSFIDHIDQIPHIIVILEFFQGLDLYDILSNNKMDLTYEDVKPILTQIIDALKYIHSLGMMHRDVKLDNILLNFNGRIKLIDYDFLTTPELVNDNKSGTPFYASPEILTGKLVDYRTDLWSLGVLLYILLTGDYPFYSMTDIELYESIIKDDFDLQYIPTKFKNIIKGLLTKDRTKRITLEHLSTLLKDIS